MSLFLYVIQLAFIYNVVQDSGLQNAVSIYLYFFKKFMCMYVFWIACMTVHDVYTYYPQRSEEGT